MDEIMGRPIGDLLPHREPMVLVTRVASLKDGEFRAEVDITEDSPFFEGPGVPAYVGVEYMAQTVGLYAGVEGALAGLDVKPGMLLGVRAYDVRRRHFFAGETLTVSARKLLHQDGGISVMECAICGSDGAEVAHGQLTVMHVGDVAGFQGAF